MLQVFGKSFLLDYLELIMWGERFENYWSQVLFEDNKTFYIYIFLGWFIYCVHMSTYLLLFRFYSFFSLVFWDMVTLYKPGCPRIYSAAWLAPNSQSQFPTRPCNLAWITSMHHHVILVTLFRCDLGKRT